MKNIHREECTYENLSQRFIFSEKRKFDLQYSQLYAVRLMVMRKKIEHAVKKKWGQDINLVKLSDITKDEDCVIIGTIFRKMELQPSVLKEISSEVCRHIFLKKKLVFVMFIDFTLFFSIFDLDTIF